MTFSPVPLRRSLLGLALLTTAATAASCKKDAATADTRFLRVTLLGGESPDGTKVGAASIALFEGSVMVTTVCVNTATDDPGDAVASLVLSREASLNLSARVTVVVTPYANLRNSDTVGSGAEFACVEPFADALAAPQSIDVDFCDGDPREVVFYLGSSCCDAGGAGGSAGASGAAGTAGQSGAAGLSGSSGAAGGAGLSGGSGQAGTGASAGQAGSASGAGGAGASGGVAGVGGAGGSAGAAGQNSAGSGGTSGGGTSGGGAGGGGMGVGGMGAGGAGQVPASGTSGYAGGGAPAGQSLAGTPSPRQDPGLRVQSAPPVCCPGGQACGAGVSSTGSRCGKNECCNSSIDACVLEPAK